MKRLYLSVLVILFTIVGLSLHTAAAMAFDEPGAENRTTTEERKREVEAKAGIRAEEEQKVRENAKEQATQARTEAKKKACEAREKNIINIMNRAAERGNRHIALFTTIAERVEAFYTEKGKTLATYDQLVSEVNAKKAAAQNAVNLTKAAAPGFTCMSDNPKGMIEGFKRMLKTQEEAVKAYRQAVKNLIVGVKSVQGTTGKQEAGSEKAE